MEAVIKKLNRMVIKGGAGNCNCKLISAKENGKSVPVSNGQIQRLNMNSYASAGGAKSKKAKLEKMKVPRLQKMAASKGIKITKKKDGKTVYLKKATLVKKLLAK